MNLLRILLFVISAFIVLISCNVVEDKTESEEVDNKTINTKSVDPSITIAELNIHVKFGKNNIRKPGTITNKLPVPKTLYSSYKVYPGKSNIHLSHEERLSGTNPVKSEPPIVVNVNPDQLETKYLDLESLKELQVMEPLEIDRDSIGVFREMALRTGKFIIADGDTILPPIRVIAGQPKLIKAETPRYKYDALCNIVNFNTDQQLPNSFVRSIVEDDDKVLWIGSAGGGIISYDGQLIEQYTKEQGLPDDDIYHLIRDSKGRLWSGSFIGDVTCFDGKYFTTYSFDQGLRSSKIISLYEDKAGNIWIGTDRYMVIFDGSKFRFFTKEDGLPDNVILSVLESKDGTFWFTSRQNGIASLKDNKITYYNSKTGLQSDFVLSCLEDNKGNMWFTTLLGGVSKFDGSNFITYSEKQGLGNTTVLDAVEDINGNLWFATFGSGVTKFDGEAFQYYTEELGLLDNYIRTLFTDENGYIWIGTDGVGLSILKPDNFMHLNKDSGLSNDLVLSIYQDHNSRMWFGTFDGGVVMLKQFEDKNMTPSLINISTQHGLNDSLIVSITQDKNKDYWIGTFRKGVSKIDAASLEKGLLKITNYTTEEGLNSNNVNKVFTDSKGNLWVGTKLGPCIINTDGIIKFDTSTPLHNAEVVEIYEDSEMNLWFGTKESGVFKVDGNHILNYNISNGFVDDIVWSITQTSNGTMFFGTDMGLQYLIGNKAGVIDTRNGLSNNQAYSIVMDSDTTMWIGTTKGLNYIDLHYRNEIIEPEITTYNKLEGLISDDFYHNSALKDSYGTYWFGTLKGLTRFHEKTFHIKPDIPISHIKEVRINNNVVNYWDKDSKAKRKPNGISVSDVQRYNNIPINLELPYGMNHVTFFFSGTEWHASSKVLNQYMLVGLDETWSSSTNDNIADYRNLSAGSYTFKVKSINSSGVYGDVVSFNFKVLSPWYETWYAIFFYFAILSFIVYLIVRWRVNILEKQKLVLEQKVSYRTKELNKALVLANQAADAKSHFIATISHELRTPLNAIIGLTHVAKKNTVDRRLEDYLKKIDRSADTLLKLINEILDFSKIEAGKMKLENVGFNLSSVVDTVIELNAQSAMDKGLEFVINVDPEIPQYLIGDPLRIGQIITNLCNNAIKFTEKGVVVVSLEKEEENSKNEIFLQVSVKDSGIGISEEQIPTLFEEFKQADTSITRKYGGTGLGLSICKLFIEMMDGQIWLDSTVGKGTTFHFDFKIGVQEHQPDTQELPKTVLSKEILVCDDNAEALNSLTGILKYNSLKYDTASSAKAAYEKMKLKNYDLLIVDNSMGPDNGLDIILKLKADPGKNDLKTILITDLASGVESFEKTIIGIDGYLTKPVLTASLIERIIQVFSAKDDLTDMEIANHAEGYISAGLLRKKEILLAEDNKLNRQVIIELAVAAGVKVDIAKNGSEALEKALEKRYDLILMDLHMPVMDGFSSTQQIRKNDIDTPIIAVTADAMQSVDKACDEAGMNDILTKPINPDYFYKILEKWLIGGGKNSDNLIPFRDSSKGPLIDFESGIRRLGGDKELYLKMLNKFVGSADKICTDIISLIDKGESEKAFIMAHSLKGESGNLGAMKVHEQAQKLEDAVKDNNIEKIREISETISQRIVQIINQMQSIDESEDGVVVTEFRPVEAIITDLIECIRTSNPRVFDLIDEMEDKNPDNNKLFELKKKIKEGDIQGAIVILEDFTTKS